MPPNLRLGECFGCHAHSNDLSLQGFCPWCEARATIGPKPLSKEHKVGNCPRCGKKMKVLFNSFYCECGDKDNSGNI